MRFGIEAALRGRARRAQPRLWRIAKLGAVEAVTTGRDSEERDDNPHDEAPYHSRPVEVRARLALERGPQTTGSQDPV